MYIVTLSPSLLKLKFSVFDRADPYLRTSKKYPQCYGIPWVMIETQKLYTNYDILGVLPLCKYSGILISYRPRSSNLRFNIFTVVR
jgi:hypothetical protein